MRTFVKLAGVDFGFNTKNLLVAGAAFSQMQKVPVEAQRQFYRQALDRLRSIPGVQSVALGYYGAPLGGMTTPVEISGKAVAPESPALVQFCSEGLTETVGMPLVKGRQFAAIDVDQAHHVAVVNETLAKRYFAADDALGRTIRLPRLATMEGPVSDPTFSIVGVVRDVANQGPRDPPAPQVFLPFTLRGPTGFAFLLRTSDEPMRIVPAVKREILAVDRQVALVQPDAMDEIVRRQFYARPRFSLLVLAIFAGTGILLVALGVYGVLAYTVSQQTREIAIRVALGGRRGHVVQMILQLGLRLVGAGAIIGVAASLATNRLLVSQLWDTSPNDPATFGAAIGIVLLIGILACWIPARRAVHVEPMVALRQE
jgi:putative ABC transport system permease protein